MNPSARRLVVVGDSLAFTDDAGPKLPGDPALYPTILGELLANATGEPWMVSVVARPGADVRDTWRTVSKDRHVQFEVLAGADAVVVAIGSFDHAPFGVPPSLEAIVPYVRPAWLRRWFRSTLQRIHPILARRSRRPRTPRREFDRLFGLVLRSVRGLARDACGVVLGPTSHRSVYYGGTDGRHPGREARERGQFAIAARHGFPAVSCWSFAEPFADRLNPDGIHWPRAVHAAVAGALARPLIEQWRGTLPRPPWMDD